MKSCKEHIRSLSFVQSTYGDVIRQDILHDANCSDEALCQLLAQHCPELDQTKLKALLKQRIRSNAGIFSICITPQSAYVLCGVSQRSERGVLVNAMGNIEAQDATLLDGALRELEEEAGYAVAQAFAPAVDNALFYLRNELGTTIEEVANHINEYFNKHRRSISYYGLILVPMHTSFQEIQTLLAISNQKLAINRSIYPLAVDFYFKNSPSDVDFIDLAQRLMPCLSPETQIKLSALVNDHRLQNNTESLRALVYYLIDLTENEKLVLVDLKHVSALSLSAEVADSSLIKSHDIENQTYDFFVPAIKDFNRLTQSVGLDVKQFYPNKPHSVAQLINANREKGKLFRKSPITPISRHAPLIIDSLLFANEWGNPRSLSWEGQKQVALGSIYHQFTHEVGTRLTQAEIPSHVAAAVTSATVNLMDIRPGTLLHQYVRPDGWVGDYYTADEQTDLKMLGISELVSDPNNPGQRVDRIKVTSVITGDQPIHAAITIANEVHDHWSIEGETVYCGGGSKQIYMPLTSSQKQGTLLIVLPDDPVQQEQVKKIAQKNSLPAITQQELIAQNIVIQPLTDLNQLSAEPDELQQLAYDAWTIGRYQIACTALEQYIKLSGIHLDHIAKAKCVLGCLYALSGKSADAEQMRLSYEQDISGSNYDVHKKLLFLMELHLARNYIIPEQAIDKLNQCLSMNASAKYQAVLNLELAMQHNRLAALYSDEVTYHDFDQNGHQIDDKYHNAITALSYLSAIDINQLPPQEKIVALLEQAFANHRLKHYQVALEALGEAQNVLTTEMQHDYPQAMQNELELQRINIHLGIGLCLARLSGTNQTIPNHFSQINPVAYLMDLTEELKSFPPMKVAWLFKRWVGPNANNLFIQGWYGYQPKDKNQGANLISVYRKYIPIDIRKIIKDLEENTISQLDLAYLGMPLPAGVTDKDFERLCEALSKNTSLTALFLRKFSDKAGTIHRAALLFEALNKAQLNGQKLSYLSYSGSRFECEEDKRACLEFLTNNQSLRILQPSLYDWKEPDLMQEFADRIRHHPHLTTLLTGLVTCKCAGEMLYYAGIESTTLKFIYPFPGKLNPVKDKDAIENITWLEQLSSDLETGKRKGNQGFSFGP